MSTHRLKTTFLTISCIGSLAIANCFALAEDSAPKVSIPSWTTEDFYLAIDNDDAEKIKEYLTDSKRTTKEFLSYYLLDYALELERDNIAQLMVDAGAGVSTLPAVLHENATLVETMLKRGVEPRGASLAAARGDTSILTLLLEHGEKDLSTAGAAQFGQLEAIKMLLEHGAPPDGLEVAALHGHEDVAKLLLESGADPNELTQFPLGWREADFPRGIVDEYLSPLHFAVVNQSKELVEMLLQHGADPNVVPSAVVLDKGREYDHDPWPTVLYLASTVENGDAAITKLLEENGAKMKVSVPDEVDERETKLYSAAQKGDKKTVVQLLEDGVQPTVFGGFYYSFMGPSWNPEIVKAFLEAGAHPDDYSYGSYPYTPAAMALTNSDVDNFKRMMEAGASTEPFLMKYVYMRIACIEGLNDAIEYLWNQGVQPGFWELLSPVSYGHEDTVKFLLAKGIRPWALRNAVEEKNVEIVKMLLEAGADPNQTSEVDDRSILDLAIESKNDAIVSMLQQVGAE